MAPNTSQQNYVYRAFRNPHANLHVPILGGLVQKSGGAKPPKLLPLFRYATVSGGSYRYIIPCPSALLNLETFKTFFGQ